MKRLIACLFLAALCVTAVAPSAHALGAYGIVYMPDEGDDTGYGIGLKKGRSFTPLLSIEPRFSFTSFPDATLGAPKWPAWRTSPCFTAESAAAITSSSGDLPLEDTFSWFILAGVDIGLGGLGVFGELKYQFLEPDIDSPIGDASADINGLAIHVGVTLNVLGL